VAAMALVEVAVAATNTKKPAASALFAAAMALPLLSMTSAPAEAGSAPEQATMGFKYLNYRDYQSDSKRMKIEEPLIWLDAPIMSDLELQATIVTDTISGASPVYMNTLAHGISDRRKSIDVTLTKFFDQFSLGGGAAVSHERDFLSRSANIETRIDLNQKNTTLAAGISLEQDEVGSTIDPSLHKNRNVHDLMLGVTQILNPNALIQSNLALSWGNGYYSDPYKAQDFRPNSRQQASWLVRYVQFSPSLNGALHGDYRYYINDWGTHAHTFDFSWYQNVGESWKVIPELRYYVQNKADFYKGEYPPPAFSNQYYSSDARLSNFGAITTALKVVKTFASGWQADVKYEYYRQSSALSWGNGSPGVEDFHAKALTLGISRSF